MTNLNVAATTTLDASGNGRVELGPQNVPGTQAWRVTGILLKTSRPGVAPIPRAEVYLDNTDPSNLQAVMYDGSFNQGGGDTVMIQGQKLIAIWTGGQSGDIASFVLSGTRGTDV